jgi:hypothetical protein
LPEQLRQLGDVGGYAPGLVEAELVDRDSSSKPFGPTLALRIRKIAVEGEAYFLHEGINAEMKGLGRLAAFSDMVESAIELRHILDLYHQMKVPEVGVPEAKFTACEAPTFDSTKEACLARSQSLAL